MSWGFVPLTRYQGGDASSVLEPLSEHLDDYEQLMVQYYGAGCTRPVTAVPVCIDTEPNPAAGGKNHQTW
jgi:hypothetical protein